MKFSDVRQGAIVQHLRHNSGKCPGAIDKIGAVTSSELFSGRTSDRPDLVEVNFNIEGPPKIERVRFNKLKLIQPAPSEAVPA
jgi:hypothetical protein